MYDDIPELENITARDLKRFNAMQVQRVAYNCDRAYTDIVKQIESGETSRSRRDSLTEDKHHIRRLANAANLILADLNGRSS